jgi:hypothetical protein
MITCKTCGSGHAEIYVEGDQGVDCASTLFEREGEALIASSYGSRFDMRMYRLKPAEYTKGTICDECIQKLIDDGTAELLREDNW